jgi:cytochrome c-type biogenesis protein CcmE
MNAKQKTRSLIVAGAILASALVVAFVLIALNENIHLYYTPTEIVEQQAPTNRPIRMGGIVVPGSIQRTNDSLQVNFNLTDGANEITVSYDGILPDLFREGQGIVAMGHLDNDYKLSASQVLAKHDESYMPKEVEQSMQVGYHDS